MTTRLFTCQTSTLRGLPERMTHLSEQLNEMVLTGTVRLALSAATSRRTREVLVSGLPSVSRYTPSTSGSPNAIWWTQQTNKHLVRCYWLVDFYSQDLHAGIVGRHHLDTEIFGFINNIHNNNDGSYNTESLNCSHELICCCSYWVIVVGSRIRIILLGIG